MSLPEEPTAPAFTEQDVIDHITARMTAGTNAHGELIPTTIERIDFLTRREFQHSYPDVPENTPLCVVVLHGAFSFSGPPFLRRQGFVPISDTLTQVYHARTGNLLLEAGRLP
jgi:hypothetical protein